MSLTVRVGPKNATKVLASDRVGRLTDLLDVDLAGVRDGSILIYESSVAKFVVTNTLTDESDDSFNFTIDGGVF